MAASSEEEQEGLPVAAATDGGDAVLGSAELRSTCLNAGSLENLLHEKATFARGIPRTDD